MKTAENRNHEHDLLSNAREKWQTVREDLKPKMQKLSQQTRAAGRQAEQWIHRRPASALTVSAAIGVLTGIVAALAARSTPSRSERAMKFVQRKIQSAMCAGKR